MPRAKDNVGSNTDESSETSADETVTKVTVRAVHLRVRRRARRAPPPRPRRAPPPRRALPPRVTRKSASKQSDDDADDDAYDDADVASDDADDDASDDADDNASDDASDDDADAKRARTKDPYRHAGRKGQRIKDYLSGLFAAQIRDGEGVWVIDDAGLGTTRVVHEQHPLACVGVMNNHPQTCGDIENALVALRGRARLYRGNAHKTLKKHIKKDDRAHIYHDGMCVMLRVLGGEIEDIQEVLGRLGVGSTFCVSIVARCSHRSEAYASGLHTAESRMRRIAEIFAERGFVLLDSRKYKQPPFGTAAHGTAMRWMHFRKQKYTAVPPPSEAALEPRPVQC